MNFNYGENYAEPRSNYPGGYDGDRHGGERYSQWHEPRMSHTNRNLRENGRDVNSDHMLPQLKGQTLVQREMNQRRASSPDIK